MSSFSVCVFFFKNTEQMSQELEKGILTLVSAYYSLPLSQGNYFHFYEIKNKIL